MVFTEKLEGDQIMVEHPNKPQRSQEVMVRQAGAKIRQIQVSLLVSEIKQGKLQKSDEISTDGKKWILLGRHSQLSKFFKIEPNINPKAKPSPPNQKSNDSFDRARIKEKLEYDETDTLQEVFPPSRKKSKLIYALISLILIGAAYFQPYLTLYSVQSAIQKKDIKSLNSYIDYAALRQNFKNQINLQMMQGMADQFSENKFSIIAMPLMQIFSDKIIDTMITPEALIALFQGKPSVNHNAEKKKNSLDQDGSESQQSEKRDIFSNSKFHYESLNEFITTIENRNGENIDFIFERRGLGWKITGINLPMKDLKSSATDIAQSSIQEVKAKEATKQREKKAQLLSDNKRKRIEKERKGRAEKQRLLKEKKQYMKELALINFEVGEGEKYGKTVPGVFGTIVNKGSRTLKKVQITVYFLNKKGTVIGEEDFYPVLVTKYSIGRGNKPLKPNYEKDFGYNVKDSAPSSWVQATAQVTDIEFVK